MAGGFGGGRGAARRPPGMTWTAEKGAGKSFHTMERGFRGFSTQWKRVLQNFPHNGSMFRHVFHTMETCFLRVFHGVEKPRPARLVGGWAPRAAGSGGDPRGMGPNGHLTLFAGPSRFPVRTWNSGFPTMVNAVRHSPEKGRPGDRPAKLRWNGFWPIFDGKGLRCCIGG